MECEHNNAVKKRAVPFALFISLEYPAISTSKRSFAEIRNIGTREMTLSRRMLRMVIHGIPEIALETFARLVFFIVRRCLISVIKCLVETGMQRRGVPHIPRVTALHGQFVQYPVAYAALLVECQIRAYACFLPMLLLLQL